MKNITHLIAFLCILSIVTGCKQKTKEPVQQNVWLTGNWLFNTGDNPEWANPDFDDSTWDSITLNTYWEYQGYDKYDGYAWYRKEFILPEAYLSDAWIKDSFQITLGKIDDTDQTFLNGYLVGVNAQSVLDPANDSLIKFEKDPDAYQKFRQYVIPSDHPAINWGGKNVIAIRVHDHGGYGGMWSRGVQEASIRDIKDYITIDYINFPFDLIDKDEYKKDILLENHHKSNTFEGYLSIRVFEFENNAEVYSDSKLITIEPGKVLQYSYIFTADNSTPHLMEVKFNQKDAYTAMVETFEVPYILTPEPSANPSINGAKIVGARPGHEIIFKIPATGNEPLKYETMSLPHGLTMDEKSGIIRGSVQQQGDYEVKIIVSNEIGADTSDLMIRIGDQLALTPPMGWNSWNCWGLSVDADKVKEAADFMVSSGLINHGWTYINIDDGWEASERTKDGVLQGNDKFPDFKELSEYVHSKGLKIGIYSGPGNLTCGGYIASYKHELIDAKTWADWGIDYLKYDWCEYRTIAKDTSLYELQKPYKLMGDILANKIDRDIVYSLCQYGMGDVWKWGEQVHGNLWRTTGDIVDTWQSVTDIGFNQDGLSEFAGPGHWNDPDMLVVGWVGWGPNLHPTRLTASEQYSHISLWALLASPLLLGNDLSRLDDFTLNLLTNDEVIQINQDPLGHQAERLLKTDDIQIWKKKLEDGSSAVGIFNMSEHSMDYTLEISKVSESESVLVRDVWRQTDLGSFTGEFNTKILSHGVTLIKLK